MIQSYPGKDRKYLLLLKADEFLRDRCITAALRIYAGPVLGMSPNPACPKNRHFDAVLKGDAHSPASALAAVRAFERETGRTPEAVIPVTEMSLESARSIAAHYGLPFLSADCVDRARNKDRMKEAFLAAGLPTARYRTFTDLAELRAAADDLGFPLIVKPTSAAHSIGVMRVDRPADLAAAFEFGRAGVESIRAEWGIERFTFQAEQYIEADREVSIEVVSRGDERRSIAVTEKYLTPPPFFAEIGHMVPSADADDTGLRSLAVRACAALGIDRGVAHVEVRVNRAGEPYLIEVAARPGGDGIMDLVERAYGVNMYDLHIRSYLGRLANLPVAPPLLGVSAIAFMQMKEGVVEGIAPITDLPSEVVSLYVSARVGDRVGASLNYDTRVGAVEFFWPEARRNLERTHLDAAARLAERIFRIR